MSDHDQATSALRAVAHPVRLQMLSLLTGAELSAAEVARELGLTHANASYHLRVLADAGELEVAGEEKIRGGVAKRYRHPWQKKPVSGPTTPEEREMYLRALGEELVRRGRDRKPRTRQYTTDAELWVDDGVWQRVVALVEEASSLIHTEARPPRTPGTRHVNLTAVAFEMTEASR